MFSCKRGSADTADTVRRSRICQRRKASVSSLCTSGGGAGFVLVREGRDCEKEIF